MTKPEESNYSFVSAATQLLQNHYPWLSCQQLGEWLEQKPTKESVLEKPMTRQEAARLLSVSLSSIDRYLTKGILTRIKIRGSRLVRIDGGSVKRLLNPSQPEVA